MMHFFGWKKSDSPLSWLVLWEENHLVDEPRNFGLIISDCGRLAVLEDHVIPLLTTQLEEAKMKSRNFDMDLHVRWEIRDDAATLRIEGEKNLP